LPGLHSVIPEPWTEEYQADLLEMAHRVFDRVEAVVGEQTRLNIKGLRDYTASQLLAARFVEPPPTPDSSPPDPPPRQSRIILRQAALAVQSAFA